jgi:hypothetical protein
MKDWIAISSICSSLSFVEDLASKSSQPLFFLNKTSALINVSEYKNAPSYMTLTLSSLIALMVALKARSVFLLADKSKPLP